MDPYIILGASENDSNDVIKDKFRKLAKKYHPDKGGDTEKFIQINEAYTKIIQNISKPKLDDKYSNMNIFKAFLQKQIMKEYKDLFMTLEEMYNGKKIKINLIKYIDCTKCNKTYCNACNGSGKVKVNFVLFGLQQKVNRDCQNCDGFGYTRECSVCENGYVSQNVNYLLKIKKGCSDGEKYAVENNSIIFVIKQYKHPRFIRYDENLILHKSISLYEAVSCLKIKCKHLNNKVYTFSTTKCIQNDIIYQLPNLGMPQKSSNIFGNLYIKFDILLPIKCSLTYEQDSMMKTIFNMTHYDMTENENISDTIELQPTNEDKLDISLVRLLRSNHQ